MFIEHKIYPTHVEFTSGNCSVVFDTIGKTYLRVGGDYLPPKCKYFQKHGKEVMKIIMIRAIPQFDSNHIKNVTEMDIVELNKWKQILRRYPAIYKRICNLLNDYKKQLRRLAKGE